MTGDTKASTKKKVKSKSEHEPSKKSSVKKTKKVDEDGAMNGSNKSSSSKKSAGATRSTSMPPKPVSSSKNLGKETDTPASSATLSTREPSDHPSSSRKLVKPPSSRNGLQAQGAPPNTNGSANPGRSSRALGAANPGRSSRALGAANPGRSSRTLGAGGRDGPNGGRGGPGRGRDGQGRGREGPGRGRGGPGRGRGPPSSRGVTRNMSYDSSVGLGGRSIAAPSRPQSMRMLPGVPPEQLPTRKPQSMIGLAGASGRAHFGRGLKVMGKNAISNRNLPPPPGSRRSKRNLMGSSHHRSMRSLYSDDDDDNDEFATDLVDDPVPNRNGTGRPESILRKSNRPTPRRTNADGSISLSLSAHSTNFSIDEDEEFHEGDPMIDRTPSVVRPTLKTARPGLGGNDGDQSMRGWTQSFKWAKTDRRGMMSDFSASKSIRSLLTTDMEFEDEPTWKQFLRYIRILAPHPDEKPIKRNIRLLIWLSLVLDFMTGLVSLVNFDQVTYCCGQPILNIAGDINWNLAIQIIIYLYLILIFLEIIPVLREGFPFNLLNPFVGLLITFAMFFYDRIWQAIAMWVIEACAVLCEFIVYRLKVRWHNQRQQRLDKTEKELVALRKERKRRRLSASTHSMDSISSDLSFEDKSFHDESAGGSSEDLARPKDVSQIRETRLLRERRLLRQAQSEHTKTLRYEFGGVSFNIGCVLITLTLIIAIARSGGLCIVDMQTPNIFKGGQIDMCYKCKGTEGSCEICEDGTSHCYYPYY